MGYTKKIMLKTKKTTRPHVLCFLSSWRYPWFHHTDTIWKMDFRELKRKHAVTQNFLWPCEIRRGRTFSVLFFDLFSKILKYVKQVARISHVIVPWLIGTTCFAFSKILENREKVCSRAKFHVASQSFARPRVFSCVL